MGANPTWEFQLEVQFCAKPVTCAKLGYGPDFVQLLFMENLDPQPKQSEFSLVNGGPVYRFFIWARLADWELQPVNRRVVAAIAVTWLPLLILTIIDGLALGSGVKIAFIPDFTVHIRFLITLPILIAVEPYVSKRIAQTANAFLDRNIVTAKDVP